MATYAWQGKHFVDGAWLDPAGETYLNRNPAHITEILGEYPVAGQSLVDEAVATARAAFPQWRRTSRIKRGDLFERLGQLIAAKVDDLSFILSKESGKIRNEAKAEIIEGLHMVQYVFGTARQPTGQVIASEIEAKDLYVYRKPRGVVAVITPWNFPFAVPLWMLGPSLLEGNTVVFKPSEETPQIGQALVELFEQAGFPKGTINLVHGLGQETGDSLARHSGVDVVCFTGSFDVGQHIRKVCAESDHKTCACETGSKSAVIVCEDANLPLAVDAAILSAFKTSGQRCVSAGRILVQNKLLDPFCKLFVERARSLQFGDPFDSESFAGPVISEGAVEKISNYNAMAKDEGAQILLDGGRITEGERSQGHFMSPFVYVQPWAPGVRTIREEVFGPHVAIVPFATDEDAIRIYNDTPYGLSMAVITESYRRFRLFREECEFGMGYVNLPCIGAEVHLPFGGVKRSGNGQPSAAALVDSITHKISFTVNHATEIVMAQGMSAKTTGK